MLNKIIIQNFKCFKDKIEVPLSSMNVLTGQNSRGKSTVLQSLLLLKQSIENEKSTNHIILNGNCVNLGFFNNIRNSSSKRTEAIFFGFEFKKAKQLIKINYELIENINNKLIANISSIKLSLNNKSIIYNRNYLVFSNEEMIENKLEKKILEIINFSRVHYLAADRIKPQDFYKKYNLSTFINVGYKGEKTAFILNEFKNNNVNNILCLESAETNTLFDQTREWLSKIFDGANIKVEDTDASIVIMKIGSSQSNLYNPNNVGFGLIYTLPIIVSCLIAEKGDIIIIENPEAHLHPSAQSRLAQFLCETAKSGVQIIIETHSDHILNGVRLSIIDKTLNKDEINIHFFSNDLAEPIMKIDLDDKAQIKKWPEGFFDQLTEDFKKLFGV